MKAIRNIETWEGNQPTRIPSIWMMVEHHLRIFGGWNRMFGRSAESYDKEVIYSKQSEQGFWGKYAIALAYEQFIEDVEDCILEFRRSYPEKKIPKKELREKLAQALLEDGWKPVKKPIMEKIADLKRQRKAEIRALRGGLTKKEWQKKLRSQKRRA